ncbi:MAG: hypothetical protein PHT79_03855 [Syntrophomonadaceae bacterium]|nr:hypothetical protein [Syntrophomonadaceae bacterium]MDD3888373.1 hypothetical protein [Syntrophomonadaceae bacterium]MDD4548878.1 hypothetical protein [Syntrophomonadaceae bacterium]
MRKMNRKICITGFTLIFLTLVLCSAYTPALAEDDLQMKVEAGFKGYARMGQALPLQVVIENQGAEIKGTLEINVNRNGSKVVYKKDASLPAGSKKKIHMYLPGNDGEILNVRLMSGEVKILEEKVKVTNLQPQELVVGVMAQDSSTAGYLAALKMPVERQRVTVIYLAAGDIPVNGLLLESLDVLVVNDFSTATLSKEQLAAINTWVEQGGMAVAAGGVNWQKTLGPLPDTFLPVKVTGSKSISSIPELESIAGKKLAASHSFVISEGEVTGGNIIARAGDTPLIVQQKIGKGNVVYLGYDLAMEPFRNWSGNEQVWHTILSRCDPHNIMSAGNSKEELIHRSNRINSFLTNIPATDLPSGGKLATFLLIYVLILGPVIYLILRKLDRRDLGWVIIPLVAILIFSSTYFFGFKAKGRDVFQKVVSIVTIEPGIQHARVNSSIGVFAPTRTEYNIDLPGDKIVILQPQDMPRGRMMSSYAYGPGYDSAESIPAVATIAQGKNTRVTFEDASRWSMRTVYCEENISKPGDIIGDLYTKDGKICGTIINKTNGVLTNCLVFSTYGYQKIARMDPGEKVDIEFIPRIKNSYTGPAIYQIYQTYPVHKPQGSYDTPWQQQEMSRQVMEMIANRGDINNNALIFIGESQEPLGTIAVGEKGRKYYSTFYISPLKLKMEDVNRVSLPPGIVNGRVISVDCQHFNQDIYGYNIDNGSVVFQMELPYAKANVQIEQLQLFIQGDNRASRTMKQELYNWETQTWEPLTIIPTGIKVDAAKFVSSEGFIRVKISTDKEQYTYLSGITVSMDGKLLKNVTTGGGE